MHQDTCTIKGCTKTGPLVRQMCSMHYTRFKRTGSTERKYYKHSPGEICSHHGCDRAAVSREYCVPHAKRAKVGMPLDGPLTPPETPEVKFERLTRWDGDCLIWRGATDGQGYGILTVKGRKQPVHRWAYENTHGEISKTLDIDHICQNTLCCNVQHLRAVTKKENAENRNNPNKNNKSSGILGVSYDKVNHAWTARVMHHRKQQWGGRWETKEDAEAAVQKLRLSLYTYYDTAMTRQG